MMKMTSRSRNQAALCIVASALFTWPSAALAQAEGSGESPTGVTPPSAQDAAAELAKKLSNPIASLISVPLQWNLDWGAGPDGDGFKSTLNIQPVIPIAITPKWNMIVRTIVPVVYQTDTPVANASQFGLGDVVQSVFFSPAKVGPSGIVWGVGPVMLYPTATDKLLGGEKWGLGPTVVVLKQFGRSTVGMLGNHIWSVAGDSERGDISTTFVQPFYSYTTPKATTLGINTETSYDWKNEAWVVPINVSISQLTRVGKQPLQLGFGARYYLEKPRGGPDWGIRTVVTFLFPKK